VHELSPLFTIYVTMRDIKSINVYSSVNSQATPSFPTRRSSDLGLGLARGRGIGLPGGGVFPGYQTAGSDEERSQQHGRSHPAARSEEHTSELQSRFDIVCRLLLEKKNTMEKDEERQRRASRRSL